MPAAKQLDLVVLLADLSGYTALTETHGSVHAASVVARYVEVASGLLRPGVRLLERVGDELVIVAEDAAGVVHTAVALRDAIDREPLFPTVRSGIHAGAVVEQDGAYLGSGLNVASRVAGYARSGQILCTAQVRASAGDLAGVTYQDLGPVRFKNILDPVNVFEIVSGRQSSEGIAIDPVCRMQVRPDGAQARLPFGGGVYHFCSFECARAFAARPDDYVQLISPS